MEERQMSPERAKETLYMLRCVLIGVTLSALGFFVVLLGTFAGWAWPAPLGQTIMWGGVVAIFAAGAPVLLRALRAHRDLEGDR